MYILFFIVFQAMMTLIFTIIVAALFYVTPIKTGCDDAQKHNIRKFLQSAAETDSSSFMISFKENGKTDQYTVTIKKCDETE